MSEQTATVEPTETDAQEVNTAPESEFPALDLELKTELKGRLKIYMRKLLSESENAREYAPILKAQREARQGVESWLEDSEEETAKKFRAARDAALAFIAAKEQEIADQKKKIEEAVDKITAERVTNVVDAEELEEAQTAYGIALSDLKSAASSMAKHLENKEDKAAVENFAKEHPTVRQLVEGKKAAARSSNPDSTGWKPSLSGASVNGKDLGENPTFSVVAKEIGGGVTAGMLQKRFISACGTQDPEFGREYEFTMSKGEEVITIKVTFRDRKGENAA